MNYIGRNPLSIVLFSPFLTNFAKFAHRFFEFDPSEIVYAVFSTTMVIMICLFAAFVWDKIGIKNIFGRDLFFLKPHPVQRFSNSISRASLL